MAAIVRTVVLGILACYSFAAADPVAVRILESASRGFLVLRSGDTVIGHGEMIQVLRGGRVDSRLILRFEDGSLYDEDVVFSQRRVFSLLTYHLVQKGPSFDASIDETFDRRAGTYAVRYREKADEPEQVLEGRLDIPSDVYNGMSSALMKNLPPGGKATGHLVAFSPSPRILKLEIAPVSEDTFFVGAHADRATRFLVKPTIGGVTGLLATAVGKSPPQPSFWIGRGPAPAFVKFEGAMFVNGPTWRIELTAPRWPSSTG
jgi:hypothetical protein